MKKLFTLACGTVLALSTYAQQGQKTLGLNLSYSDNLSALGLGVKGQYNFTKAVRGEVSFNYFFENDNVSAWDLNANVHYLFPLSKGFTLYPLAGMTYSRYKVDLGKIVGIKLSGSTGKFGVNLGGGASYDIDKKWRVNAEMKYQLLSSSYSSFVPSLGIVYKF